MINPMQPGPKVVTQDGKTARIKWKVVLGGSEDQYQPKLIVGPGAPDPFIDLDGDGEIEIMTAVTNEHGDGRTCLVIFGADNGERRFEQSGLDILAADDLDGDGVLEVLFRVGEFSSDKWGNKTPVDSGENTLRIANWNGAEFIQRWQARDVTPLLTPPPLEGDLTRTVGARVTRNNPSVWRRGKGSDAFLLRFDDGVFACRLTPGGTVTKLEKVDRHAALGNLAPPPKKNYTWDGRRLSVPAADGSEVRVTYELPRWRRYLAQPPVVGVLDGEVRVLARTHDGDVISVAADGGDRRVLGRQTPHVNPVRICDLDGDGTNEVLLSTRDQQDHPIIVALDGHGNERLRIPWPQNTSETVLGPVGRMGAGKGAWIAVRYREPYKNTRVVVYNGRDGREIWTRDYLAPTRSAATTFVLHLPTAVVDADGDGADDLVASSENHYAVISAVDNREIVPPMTITATVPGHWGAYATPVVFPMLGKDQAQVLHDRAYALSLVTDLAGRNVWHHGLTRDTTNATLSGLADLDADGRVEVVTTQRDGLLRAFAAVPAGRKCPSCPEDQPSTAANAAGRVLWEHRLKPPVSDVAAADLDADGCDELLIGSGDGTLKAVKQNNGECSVLWEQSLGRTVGSPVVADLDGDGTAEILVTVADGRLVCLRASGSRVSRGSQR